MFELTQTAQSVSDITKQVQRLIEQHLPFQNVWVRGQVSNCRSPNSGHIYFTLKDERAQISCVLWQSSAPRFRSFLRDGEDVEARGKITVYDVQGKYQITVEQVTPLGVGALQRAFEEVKGRLRKEGLFDEAHKKPLPPFPRKVGVVTSASGDAFQDIKQLHKRYPLVEIVLHPTRVQGERAAAEIVHAIQSMNRRNDIDVLIVGRGGGSLEDLWAFNEEIVARAIFASRIPVVSAVGHEMDTPISDSVADRRAATPLEAGHIVVPDQNELRSRLNGFEKRLSPPRLREALQQRSQRVADVEAACRRAMERCLSDRIRDLETYAHRLNALSPLATLARGYSISRKVNGDVLTTPQQVSIGDRIEVQLAHGHLTCRVEELSESSRSSQKPNAAPLGD